MSTNHGIRRASKRLRSISFDDNVTMVEQPTYRKLSVAPADVASCVQFCFPASLCRHGCRECATSIKCDIDERDHDDRMAVGLENRKSYKSKRCACSQPWKKSLDRHDISSASTAYRQHEFIETIHRVDPHRLLSSTVTPRISRRLQGEEPIADVLSPSKIPTDDLSSPATIPAQDISIDNGAPSVSCAPSVSPTNDVITSPSKRKLRNVTLHNQAFYSQKQYFSYDIPSDHYIVKGSYLTALKKDREALHQLRDGAWLQRFAKGH